MRLLIDTNLLVSAILNAGLPRQLLTAARAGRFDLCTSEHLLDELYRVLGYAKLASRLNQANVTALDVVTQLRTLATVVTPAHVPRVVRTDPDDDHVLAAALQARADLIVTGDTRDLLPLGRYEGIFIVTARQAWDRLALQVN